MELFIKPFFWNFFPDGPVVIVRVEEVLLVVLVLIIWVAAIALFFNRWGKIRMLEPYQPKFHQQPHRPSCPLAPLSPPVISSQVSNTLPRTQKQTTTVCAIVCFRNTKLDATFNKLYIGGTLMFSATYERHMH